MTFHLGCAIWAYKAWVGELFPPGSRAADFLYLYSRRFTAVEGNTTFYSVPDAATVQRWREVTPEGFQFCPKLPRAVTHQGALAVRIPETLAFLERMQELGERLGVVFAQMPPSYSPESWADLTAFLQAFPHQQVRLAVELRHLGWFKPEWQERLNQMLASFGVGRVLLDTRPIYDCPDDPQIASERRKPKVPLQAVSTAPFNLVRYISHPDAEYNQRFLAEWATQVATWLRQNQQVYFFVHCPVEQRSPGTARQFQQLLEQQQALVPSLPWNVLMAASTASTASTDAMATQLKLF